jgi:hypothetical protein
VKRWIAALLASVWLVSPPVAHAKKKARKPDMTVTNQEGPKPPPPNDKSNNDGRTAQGRMNATEGAAQEADSPHQQLLP